MTLGFALRFLREHSGCSLQAAALLAELPANVILLIEQGRYEPTATEALRILAAYATDRDIAVAHAAILIAGTAIDCFDDLDLEPSMTRH